MKKMLLTVALLLLVAAPSSAQQSPSLRVPMVLFAATSAADWTSTAYCTTSPYCHEANPMFAWSERRFGTPAMIGIGASSDVAMGLIFARVGRHHPRIAAVGLYATAAFRVVVAARNARIGYLLHQPCPPSHMFCR